MLARILARSTAGIGKAAAGKAKDVTKPFASQKAMASGRAW